MRVVPILYYGAGEVPYDMLKQHEKQIMSNHGQTLDQIVDRGGLDWLELYAVLNDTDYTSKIALDTARDWVKCEINKYHCGVIEEIVKVDKLDLRPCIVKIHPKNSIPPRNAYFHRWCDRSQIVDPSPMMGGSPGGVLKFITALVEYEDGSMDECSPKCIVFTDRG